ncbi:hypothetical protein, partial [uncultured Fibrobacter sp.]|uniref:hypothetical protein n=1 Tax=uncultured Fibrobacter sp. TaxID=261512 RepID=UPI00259919A6
MSLMQHDYVKNISAGAINIRYLIFFNAGTFFSKRELLFKWSICFRKMNFLAGREMHACP